MKLQKCPNFGHQLRDAVGSAKTAGRLLSSWADIQATSQFRCGLTLVLNRG